MKVFYKYIAILIMACGSVFLFSSCDNDDDVKKSSSEIIGKWKYEEYGDEVYRLTIQFKTDNTFTCTEYYYDSYYDEYEYETWKGIYEYDKETKMIITYYEEDDEVGVFRYMGSYLLDEDGDRWYKMQ